MSSTSTDGDSAISRVVDRLNLVIPDEIHAYRQWVLWRLEPGDDKPRKVPYYVNGKRRSGTQGSESDLSQLVTFPEAVARFKVGGFDGIGIAVLPNSPIKAIDLDNCVSNGTLTPEAEAIVGEANSYYELSPSRAGIRILAYGVLPSRKAMHLFGPGRHLELFGVSGFVTVTGDVLEMCPIRPMSHAFQAWVCEQAGEPKAPPAGQPPPAEAVEITAAQRADIRAALNYLDADDYGQWVELGLALKTLGDVGRGLWLEWSQQSARFNPEQAADKWIGFKPSGKIGYETILYRAQERGWVNPASSGVIPRIKAPPAAANDAQASSLPLIYAEDVSIDQVNMAQIVEDILTAGGLSVMYGESNSGKSFLACDMDCHIGAGTEWLGKRTVKGAVLYVAGEGAESIKMRVLAWRQHHGINPAVAVVPVAVDLRDPHADVGKVIAAAAEVEKHYGMPVVKITIDTLARAFGGGNENASEDMGAVISNADAIRGATKAHVQFIHHAGKDAAKGSRGHSSLKAATDTEIEVTGEEGTKLHTARITKQRDLSSRGEEMTAKFHVVEMGTDQWGKAITTCVVEPTEQKPARKSTKKRGSELREAIKDALLEQASRSMKRGDLVKRLVAAGFTQSPIYRAIGDMAQDGEVTDSMNIIHLIWKAV